MRIQRLDGHAVPDPGWPQTGATLPNARFASQMRLFPDGTGGVFAGWGIAAVVAGHDLAYFLAALVSLLVFGVLLSAELALAMQRDD